MALMTRSIDMSFSASRLRSTATSMSIGSLLVRTVPGLLEVTELAVAGYLINVLDIVKVAELDLDPAWPQFPVPHRAPRAVDIKQDAVQIRADYSRSRVGETGRRLPLLIVI